VRCWGYNPEGELGIPPGQPSVHPTPVTVPGITTATQVAVGRNHTCAVLTDGTVRCWGDGTSGQLGNGSTVSSSTPVQVSGITTATKIVASDLHTCALLAFGSVMCWGSNSFGQLGDGTTTTRPAPVAVSGLTTARQLTASTHVCAALVDLTARCWGQNNWRQLGDGDVEPYSAVPVQVRGTTAVIDQVAAGGGHTCLHRTDATVACWGLNNLGQLGTGDMLNRRFATAVPGLTNVLSVGSGVFFSCALLTDRTVRCWGDNLSGKLGNGTTQGSLVPVTVLIGEAQLPPLAIATASLPAGTLGQAYTATLASTGGVPPVSWTLQSGALPPGVGLQTNGTLAGTPGAAGSFTFTLAAQDSARTPASVTRQFTVTIVAPPPPPPNPPLLDDFNRSVETPVFQSGSWSTSGIGGRPGAPLSQSKLRSFPSPNGGYSFRVQPYLGGDMEAGVTVATRPSTNQHVSVFVCLQSASLPAFDGYELRAKVLSGTDLFEIRRVDDGVSTVLATKALEIATNGSLLLRRVGTSLQFWWKPSGGSWTQQLTATDANYQWGMIGTGGLQSGALDDFRGGSLLSLLDQYAPELRLHPDEIYTPDDSRVGTDLSLPGQDHAVVLRNASGAAYASADPASPLADLSRDFLAAQGQPGETLAQPHFYSALSGIENAILDYHEWIPSRAGLRQRGYGRIVTNLSNGDKWLEYWFFYYYNPKQDAVSLTGDHEADWEWVFVQLSPTNVPRAIATSRHGGGERCTWGASEISITGTGKPIVYVARDSHANYLTPGDHQVGAIPLVFTDYTSNDGPHQVPAIEGLSLPFPGWITWDGYWGATRKIGGQLTGESPKSPGM
jgi:hypothetical protein